ncbi:hypothetical protein K402DRAFT_458262 [Aulographum hederae CBS 113979]|uniref:Uncharacterized protein n=1 Tax=Aulographum hederae CBS 113979 TaxID=1176131 RepID=A0A6G1GJR2_9PEZI|nr:hypothetical protein K402DRAFT_458262 [Aulographum hederae CBS 113979]
MSATIFYLFETPSTPGHIYNNIFAHQMDNNADKMPAKAPNSQQRAGHQLEVPTAARTPQPSPAKPALPAESDEVARAPSPGSSLTQFPTPNLKNTNSSMAQPKRELPLLPMNLHKRKDGITKNFVIIFSITCVQVQLLLWFCHTLIGLRLFIALLVPNIILGIAAAIDVLHRAWLLMKKGSPYLPIGGKRFAGDYFFWNLVLANGVICGVLNIRETDAEHKIRLFSLPPPIVLFFVSTQLLISGLLNLFKLPTPIRLSSTPFGHRCPPGVLVIMEDICAVNGNGGTIYREALMERYNESARFRRMLRRINWFWGIGSFIVAGGLTAMLFTLWDPNVVGPHYRGLQKNERDPKHPKPILVWDTIFVCIMAWVFPWVWGGFGAWLTIKYASNQLRKERMEYGIATDEGGRLRDVSPTTTTRGLIQADGAADGGRVWRGYWP